MVGVTVFVIGIVVAGLAYPGYSQIDQMISELGGVDATRAWIQNANFIVFGLCVILFAIGLMRDAGKPFAGAVLLGVLGLCGTALEGVAHCDSGCKGKTSEGGLHLMLGLVGFVAGVVALFLLLRRWRRDPRWQSHVRFTKICAWSALGGLVLFVVSGGTPQVDGLAQRIFVAPLLIFIFGTGLRIVREPVAISSGRTAVVRTATT